MSRKYRTQGGHFAFIEVGFPILFHLIDDIGDSVETLDWKPSTKLFEKVFPEASFMIGSFTFRDFATKRFTQNPDGDCIFIKESATKQVPKTKVLPDKLFELEAKTKGLYFAIIEREVLRKYLEKHRK